jgi:hypothetical protein
MKMRMRKEESSSGASEMLCRTCFRIEGSWSWIRRWQWGMLRGPSWQYTDRNSCKYDMWKLHTSYPKLIKRNLHSPNHYQNLCQVIQSKATKPITNSKMQSPSWKANNHSASQETHLSSKPKLHYRVYNSPPLDPTLSQINPVRTFLLYFHKINSNVIFPSTLTSSELFLPFRFSNQNMDFISHIFHACYMSIPSHPSWFYHPNNTWCRSQ